LKKLILAIVSIAALAATPARAQIPVTDVAHINTDVQNHIESIAKYVEQINQLIAQLNQMKQQYESMTGNRGLGSLQRDPRYRDYLPTDWQQSYDTLRATGEMTGPAKAIFEATSKFDSCGHVKDELEKTACQSRAVKGAMDKAMAVVAYEQARQRASQIEALINEINATSDPKSIQELQARIAGEQALLQNEATKLQLFQMAALAEDRIQEQQQRELNAKIWARRGTIPLTPLTFE
jgi:type IV secretion system protein VirB5